MKNLTFIVFLISSFVFSQKIISKKIKSDAPYIDINTKGIDNLKIENSNTNELIMVIDDKVGLGVIENLSCNDFSCVLSIKTEVKIDHPLTNKVNQFHIESATNVTAIVKIPTNKKVTVLGETIDIQSKGYNGQLRILIDKGEVVLEKVLGVTEVNLFAGSLKVMIDNNSLDLKTRKGKITRNNQVVKSTVRKKQNNKTKLIVRSVQANIILNSRTQ